MYIYKTVEISFPTAERVEKKINEIAQEGWELVCFVSVVSVWRKNKE